MKKKFTFLIAALALLTMITQPMRALADETTIASWGKVSIAANTAIIASGGDSQNINHAQFTSDKAMTTAGTYCYYGAAAGGAEIIFSNLDLSGYDDITMTFYTRASQQGNMQISWSSNGTDYEDLNAPSITKTEAQKTSDPIPNTATYIKLKHDKTSGSLYFGTIVIKGTVISSGSNPSMSVSTNSIDFGSNAISPSEPYTETFSVTFANLTQNLSVSVGSGLTGVNVDPATISKDASSPATVTVSYNPTAAGTLNGNITVSNTDDNLSKTVAVTGSAYDPTTVDTYEKYTGTLVEGDYVICANAEVAMKNTVTSNRLDYKTVTVTDDKISNPDASIIWHVAPEGAYWTIYNASADKYAAGTTSNNQAALIDDVTDYAKWDITYQYSYYTVICYGRNDQTNKYLRRNGTYGWAVYGSGTGNPPTFYKRVITNQVAKPTFSVEAGTYFETKSVELSCTTDGADIYYTTDGTTPSSTHGTKYTTAISVSSNMTIKAIAVKSGMADSDVATAAYVIQLPYSTIPAIFAAATSTSQAAKVTFGGWLVTGINGGQAFVTDGTNGLIIYQSSHGFTVGNTLTGTVDCNIVLFNTSAEITGVKASDLTIGSGTATPNVTTIDALGSVNTGSVVTLNNLTYNGSELSDGTNTIYLYTTLYNDAACESGKTYNITGVFFQNNSEKRILPRSAADIVEATVQHNDYTLTIDADSHVTEYFLFDNADPTNPTQYATTSNTATIQDGTTVLVSLDLEDGYVVDEITVTYGSSQTATITTETANVSYIFVMPAYNATLAVTTKVAPVVTTYTLVSTQADLMPGKHYIIVGSNAGETEFYAMGEQNGNFRSAVLVTKVGDNIQGTDDVCEFVLSGDATQGWSFYDISTSMYLKAVNGNELASTATLLSDNYCYWTFDFNVVNTADAIKLIQSNKYTDRFINFNNSTNPKRFANYKTSSNQRPVSIYVKDGDKDLELYSPTELGNNKASITVPANGTLTVKTNGSLTSDEGTDYLLLQDGAQLFTTNTDIKATVQKTITGFNTNDDGWYLIASPVVGSLVATNVTNLIPSGATYDLYYLDETETMWRNYKPGTGTQNSGFSIDHKKGYLYANEATTNLQFAGTLLTNNTSSYSVELTKSGNGWNLIGNPMPFKAIVNKDYYVINGRTVEASDGGTVPPCTGIIVEAATDGEEVTFSKPTTAGSANNGNIQMVLAQTVTTRGESNAETLDNAIVSFNEGSQLSKFYFGEQNANIYIPQNGKDYAIVNAEAQGEMPVNFKANASGTYTINIEANDVEMNYLHLIDNITGMDVDLLQTPSYTFEARKSDYANRFRLVFSANNANENGNDNFAFISNGQIILTNVDNDATIQVIDALGRMIISTNANNHVYTDNMAPGVYVLRLVNGNDVKTQKIVVK